MALRAAAVTFYGGIAVVPIALLATWVTGRLAGADRVRRLTAHTIAALPSAIGAPRASVTTSVAPRIVNGGFGHTLRERAPPAPSR